MGRSFNGTTQYADSAANLLFNSTDVTISMWVKIQSGVSGGIRVIMGTGGYDGSSVNPGLGFVNRTGTPDIQAEAWEDGVWVETVGTQASYTADTWTHIALVSRLTTSEINQFYSAGSQSGSNNTTAGRTAESQRFDLAINREQTGQYFDGEIAEVAIFDTNLSASEISDLANGDSPLAVNESACVCYWRMDGSSSTESDLVSSRTLTYYNSPGSTTGPTVDDPPSGGVTGSGTPAAQAADADGTAERELPGSGTPAAQAADADGTGERVLTCSGTLTSAASSVDGTASLQLKVELTAATGRELRDEDGALVASLANISYEWYDKDTDTTGNPDFSGTFSTNGSGEATIQLPGTALTSGQYGLLVLEHPSDNTIRGIYRIPVT